MQYLVELVKQLLLLPQIRIAHLPSNAPALARNEIEASPPAHAPLAQGTLGPRRPPQASPPSLDCLSTVQLHIEHDSRGGRCGARCRSTPCEDVGRDSVGVGCSPHINRIWTTFEPRGATLWLVGRLCIYTYTCPVRTLTGNWPADCTLVPKGVRRGLPQIDTKQPTNRRSSLALNRGHGQGAT